jgi:alkanesulfonate monooxygenase SsuD/methylene tetrahydromethanopterin reductase-like flavin-dependent oxidoreductase (luciferase family)
MVPPEFTSVWIQDHLQVGRGDTLLEGWSLLAHLATAFPRFLYGNLVLSQSYRNPALLAKMAATLQYLTGGRVVLAIGAGWLDEEYRAYGYDYPSGGIRVQQLAEAIEVIRAVWAEGPTTFRGQHYRVEGVICEVPPHDPIPIMVGTSGPKALAVTARHADWWNWDAPWDPTFREPYERLRGHCEAIGRSFDDITLTAGAFINLPDDPATFEPTYFHDYYEATFPILGPSPADVIREIETLVEVGVRHFPLAFRDMASLERFIQDVVPNLRLEPSR